MNLTNILSRLRKKVPSQLHTIHKLERVINLFKDKNDAFQSQPITCESGEKIFRRLPNDCSTDYDHISISFIIPVTYQYSQ